MRDLGVARNPSPIPRLLIPFFLFIQSNPGILNFLLNTATCGSGFLSVAGRQRSSHPRQKAEYWRIGMREKETRDSKSDKGYFHRRGEPQQTRLGQPAPRFAPDPARSPDREQDNRHKHYQARYAQFGRNLDYRIMSSHLKTRPAECSVLYRKARDPDSCYRIGRDHAKTVSPDRDPAAFLMQVVISLIVVNRADAVPVLPWCCKGEQQHADRHDQEG